MKGIDAVFPLEKKGGQVLFSLEKQIKGKKKKRLPHIGTGRKNFPTIIRKRGGRARFFHGTPKKVSNGEEKEICLPNKQGRGGKTFPKKTHFFSESLSVNREKRGLLTKGSELPCFKKRKGPGKIVGNKG